MDSPDPLQPAGRSAGGSARDAGWVFFIPKGGTPSKASIREWMRHNGGDSSHTGSYCMAEPDNTGRIACQAGGIPQQDGCWKALVAAGPVLGPSDRLDPHADRLWNSFSCICIDTLRLLAAIHMAAPGVRWSAFLPSEHVRVQSRPPQSRRASFPGRLSD